MTHGSIDELETALREADYLPDRGLATALYLALALEKPVLLEGDAGVGKTEAAKAHARCVAFRRQVVASHNLRSLEELATVVAGIERRHAA